MYPSFAPGQAYVALSRLRSLKRAYFAFSVANEWHFERRTSTQLC